MGTCSRQITGQLLITSQGSRSKIEANEKLLKRPKITSNLRLAEDFHRDGRVILVWFGAR